MDSLRSITSYEFSLAGEISSFTQGDCFISGRFDDGYNCCSYSNFFFVFHAKNALDFNNHSDTTVPEDANIYFFFCKQTNIQQKKNINNNNNAPRKQYKSRRIK